MAPVDRSWHHRDQPHRTLRRGHRGDDVRAFQKALNQRAEHVPQHLRTRLHRGVVQDGVFGNETLAAWREVRYAVGLPRTLAPTVNAQRAVSEPHTRTRVAKRRSDRRRRPPLRERAYQQAAQLVGVMEQGANNRGPAVERIIREGGGLPGQAWCGWFCAAVYKRAGSKAVEWRWGAVRLLTLVSGVHRTSRPERGDLVRFTFDHVGMFVADHGTEIETLEGNTGATGAVSDSATGGDGVYRKRRAKHLVHDYLRVTR